MTEVDNAALPDAERDREVLNKVRSLYEISHRLRGTRDGLTRCRELVDFVAEDLPTRFKLEGHAWIGAKDPRSITNNRLSFIHDKIVAQEIPANFVEAPAMHAALKTLQAYGNFASHSASEPPPPAKLVSSATEAIEYVFQWYERYIQPPADMVNIKINDRPRPGLLERRRLGSRFRRSVARVHQGPGSAPRITVTEQGLSIATTTLDVSTPVELLGPAILGYLKVAQLIVVEISRIVVGRETDESVEAATAQLVVARLEKIAERRPDLVPPSRAADARQIVSACDEWQRSMVDGEKLPMATFHDLRQRDILNDLIDWFELKYLGFGTVGRDPVAFAFKAGVVAFLVWFVGFVVHGIGYDTGRAELRAELRSELCGKPSEPTVCKGLLKSPAPQK